MTLINALRRISSVASKEVRQLIRDPFTMGFVVGVPIVQLLLFGYAINQDLRHVATAVVDQSNTRVSRLIVGQLAATQTFQPTRHVASVQAAEKLLQKGNINAMIVVPTHFTTAYYRGRGAEISIQVNATDPVLARAIRASVSGLETEINRQLQNFWVEGREFVLRSMERRRGPFPRPELVHQQPLRFAVLNRYNPEIRTAVFVVPALLGVILTTTMILMTALSIVRERERGTFEFLIATPIQRIELMMGKIAPYIIIGLIQVALVLVSGLLLFHVPINGPLLDLSVSSLVFIAANLTLGLVISSVTATQLQATLLSFFFFLPSVLLSGFMFPFESMPKPAQWLGELLPLTHYIRNIKSILLRGSNLAEQMPDLLAMVIFAIVGMVAATLLFRKRLG